MKTFIAAAIASFGSITEGAIFNGHRSACLIDAAATGSPISLAVAISDGQCPCAENAAPLDALVSGKSAIADGQDTFIVNTAT